MPDERRYPGSDSEQALSEALASTPMLQEAHAPSGGGARHLSPMQFFTVTHEPRTDLEGIGDDFGLFEVPCKTIDKRGVRLFNRWFSHPAIMDYITGDKRGPQRKLVIRYDRAHAARGVLREVQLLEIDDRGRYERLMVLGPADEARHYWSRDQIVRSRNAYLRALISKRGKAEQAYAKLQRNGLDLADRLMEQTLNREREQRRNAPEPMPATPIVHGEQRDANADEGLGRALAESEALGEGAPAGTVVRKSQSSPDDSALGDALGGASDDVDAAEQDRPESQPDHSPLSDALGGMRGFQPKRGSS